MSLHATLVYIWCGCMDCAAGGIYADTHGVYGDNQFRFTLLTLAALEAPLVLPLGEKGLYGQECIFVANDW